MKRQIVQGIEELEEQVKTLQRMGLKEGLRTVAHLSRRQTAKFLYRYNVDLGRKFYLPVRSLQLEITTRCNLKCIICDHAYQNIRGRNLTLSDFEAILNKLPNLLFLAPAGMGEPLLNPELFSMLEVAKARAIRTYINTNFTIFSEEKAKKLAMLADDLVISFSGALKETYEDIHCGASFDTVIENIKRFMQIKKSLGQKTAEVSLKFIIINKNIHEMQRLITLADALGIKKVCFDDLIPFEEINDLTVEEATVAEEISWAKKIAKEKDIRLIIDLRRQSYTISKCSSPFAVIFVDVNGEIYPCCNLGLFWGGGVPREKFSFGNIFTDDLSAIWRGERFEALRTKIAQNGVLGICKKSNCLYVSSLQGIHGKESGDA